jgi:hypothetical protein
VSLAIAPAPVSALVPFLFAGIALACLVVDTAGSATLSRVFYEAKLANTPLLAFQGLMLVIGAFTYSANLLFAFTRNSPLTRRVSDVVGFFLFASSVTLAIRWVGPLERLAAAGTEHSDIVQLRWLGLALTVLQVIQQFVSFKNQSATAKTKQN